MKMNIKVIIVGVAFVATAIFPTVSALKCYECSSVTDCNLWNVPQRDGCIVCTKIIEGGTLTKGCGTSSDAEYCFETAAKTTCVCYSDYCNTSTKMTLAFWTITACLGIYILDYGIFL